jgi:hypothetical protein
MQSLGIKSRAIRCLSKENILMFSKLSLRVLTGKLKYLRVGGLFLTEYVKKLILTTGFRYVDILITETRR